MHLLLLIPHWILYLLHAVEHGSGLAWWGGFGSDLGEFAIIPAIITWYLTRNCKVKWCWRIHHHPVDGTTAFVCSHHHTIESHRKLQQQHDEKHPDRLGHGEGPKKES